MIEKNYDPDNENCPEKETVENLHQLKMNSEKNNENQFAYSHATDTQNSFSKNKNNSEQTQSSDEEKI